MEKEIQSIAKAEELSVEIAWSELPAGRRDAKIFWPSGIMVKITSGEKETSIDFDWREIRDFIAESDPLYCQKIRTKIQEKIRELKRKVT